MHTSAQSGPSLRVVHDYYRRPQLEFYRQNPNPFYAATFELEATRLRQHLRATQSSTYAGFCRAFHRALLSIEAFRVRLRGEDVVVYDHLDLGLTVPAPGGTFSFVNLPWHPALPQFLTTAGPAMTAASQATDLSGADAAPYYAFYTALPRLPFIGLSHVRLRDPCAGQPAIAFGKFSERDGRCFVPVSIQVNHVFIDGSHLGELYEASQAAFAADLSSTLTHV